MFYKTIWALDKLVSILIIVFIITGDIPHLTAQTDQVRRYTSAIEFDYPTWVWDAIWSKIDQSAISAPYIFDQGSNKQVVFEYLRTTDQLSQAEFQIEKIFSDPNVTDKETTSEYLRAQRDQLTARQAAFAPFAESVLQSQVNNTLAELGLTTGGQTIPPLLYHNSPTPLALIVSPRDHVEQTTNVSILPSLTLDQQIKLEDDVTKSLNVSTLIVPVGGIGVYPTMVMETTDLNWMLSTVSHEWTHNYLNLRPLGINYSTTPELRTMNETTASISGDEVGKAVIQKYYPELLASDPSRNPSVKLRAGLVQFNLSFLPSTGPFSDTPPFDFRAEMHTTRVKADELLSQGKIDEAETYMEQRRELFFKNGYLIRKLNQAYFAFYGAYADVPGGAAGEDPVGPTVRALRAQSKSLADFINTISWMTSFKQLQKAIQKK
ncbi:MAG: hypothetical protein ABI986_04945 [Chloroflexota bacterium]